jgi:acyl carrier protein
MLVVLESFIQSQHGVLRAPLDLDTRLLDKGIIDSFALVSLSEELARAFALDLPPDALLPEDFETPRTLWTRLEQLMSP